MILKKIIELHREIQYLEGDGNYTPVHFANSPKQIYTRTLSYLGLHLPGLVRIHKSYLVNPRYVTDYRANERGGIEVQVAGRWLAVSRRRFREAEILFKGLDELVL